MVQKLPPGRNDLYRMIECRDNLQEILVKGRLLESDFHDYEGIRETGEHMHWYRKILEDYDSDTDTILLSKKGSRRLIKELDEPEKKFTRDELYNESLQMNWKVLESDYKLF